MIGYCKTHIVITHKKPSKISKLWSIIEDKAMRGRAEEIIPLDCLAESIGLEGLGPANIHNAWIEWLIGTSENMLQMVVESRWVPVYNYWNCFIDKLFPGELDDFLILYMAYAPDVDFYETNDANG